MDEVAKFNEKEAPELLAPELLTPEIKKCMFMDYMGYLAILHYVYNKLRENKPDL